MFQIVKQSLIRDGNIWTHMIEECYAGTYHIALASQLASPYKEILNRNILHLRSTGITNKSVFP